MLHARAVVDLADALDGEIEERGGSRLLAEVELPLIDLLALMEQTGIAVDIDHLQSLEAEFAGGVKLAAEAAYAAIGKEINLGSPKQLQVVLFDELGMPKTKRTKTGYTTDADALVGLLAKVEEGTKGARIPQQPAAPPRRRPAAADHRGPAQDGGRRRPHPHDVQPADRGDRPALVHRPQPPEHPDPHRGGPPHPRGLHRGRRLRVPDDGRLQPDRDADHGRPVRGRRAHRGLPVRPRLPLDHRGAGLRRAGRRRHTRSASQDQGDELRARLRPVRVRPRRAAAHPPERGPGADGRVLRDVRRRPRLPVERGRRGPAQRLHRDDPRPPPLPPRPHLRQPPAPRDGRADGPERPDPGIRRRPHQGRDAPRPRGPGEPRPAVPDAAPGPRRARLRRLPRRARGARGPGPRADGRRRSLAVPLDVSVGTGHSWHEAAH